MRNNEWIDKLNIAKIAMENERVRDSERIVFLAMNNKIHHKIISSNDSRVDYYKFLDVFTVNGIPLHINDELTDTEVRAYQRKSLGLPVNTDIINTFSPQYGRSMPIRPITPITLPMA